MSIASHSFWQPQHEQPIFLLFVWPFGNCRMLLSHVRRPSLRFCAFGIMLLTRRQNELRGNLLQRKSAPTRVVSDRLVCNAQPYEFCFKNQTALPQGTGSLGYPISLILC